MNESENEQQIEVHSADYATRNDSTVETMGNVSTAAKFRIEKKPVQVSTVIRNRSTIST